MKGNKIPKSILFLASPLLALPDVIYGVSRRSGYNLILLSFFFGVLSYLYVPSLTNDRARYFEMYVAFESFSLSDFFTLIVSKRADFILQGLVFGFNKIGVSIQFLLLFVTSFTTGVWFYVFFKIAEPKRLSNQLFFLCFTLILFSFSLPDLFSGIRFYFASAFVMLAFYKEFFEKRRIVGISLLTLAVFIHFSSLLFVPLYACLILLPKQFLFYRFVFVGSFLFMLLPKDFLTSIFTSFSISEGYETKAELYLEGDDFIERGISAGSANYIIVYMFSIVWSYFAYLYLIFTLKRKSLFRNMIYLFFAAVNLFYSVTTVYSRYLIVLKFVFSLLLIYELLCNSKSRVFIVITILLFALSIVSNLIVMRYNIFASFFHTDVFLLITIFFRQITPSDFLY